CPRRAAVLLRHQRALELRGRRAARGGVRPVRAARRLPRGGGRVTMRFGYWLPVFGGWLRNVPDEGMEASWEYVRRLARRSEAIGFDVTLIAELNLNDIKGPDAPALGAGPRVRVAGRFDTVENATLEPKPVSRPRPTLYAGGESEAAKQLIARSCDAYLMHGDPPERIGVKVADLRARRERLELPPLKFGVAGYVVCRPTEAAAQTEVARIPDG